MLFAIDPGDEFSAYCFLGENRKIHSFEKVKNEILLDLILSSDRSHNLIIEEICSYGMAVGASVFQTCRWSGRFQQAYGDAIYIPRLQVKLAICHSPKANDSNIRTALIDMYGPGKDKAIGTKKNPGPLYGMSKDCWAALALAITAQEMGLK